MPTGKKSKSVCSGLLCRSITACLNHQLFQTKVYSSKAQVALPGTWVVKWAISG